MTVSDALGDRRSCRSFTPEPLAAGLLDHHVVSARVNKTVHDDAGLVEPVEREGLF